MTKSLFLLPALLLATACATTPDTKDYVRYDCDSLRALVSAQDSAASVRGIEIYNDQGLEEVRTESGSPWAGRARTRDESNLKEERSAIREAYRRQGCKR